MKIKLPDKIKFVCIVTEGLARAGPLSFLEIEKNCLMEARHGPP